MKYVLIMTVIFSTLFGVFYFIEHSKADDSVIESHKNIDCNCDLNEMTPDELVRFVGRPGWNEATGTFDNQDIASLPDCFEQPACRAAIDKITRTQNKVAPMGVRK